MHRCSMVEAETTSGFSSSVVFKLMRYQTLVLSVGSLLTGQVGEVLWQERCRFHDVPAEGRCLSPGELEMAQEVRLLRNSNRLAGRSSVMRRSYTRKSLRTNGTSNDTCNDIFVRTFMRTTSTTTTTYRMYLTLCCWK